MEKAVVSSGCWGWTGSVNIGGYAKIGVRREGWRYAHREIWKHLYGPIPMGMKILHRCDNPRCVNPEHLFMGTQQDNIDDAIRKGKFKDRHLRRKTQYDDKTDSPSQEEGPLPLRRDSSAGP